MDALIDLLDTLPPLPESSGRLERLLADPLSTARDITAVVGEDAALASYVLRLANSAYYAVPGGVDSLTRAVSCLGFSAIHQIALCLQTQRLLSSAGHPIPRELMEHGRAVSALCVRAAEGLRVGTGAFIAGLLHDIGRMAVFAVAPQAMQRYCEALAKGARHSLSLEAEVLGMDHQQVGRRLAERWRYPEHLALAVSDHHGPGIDARDRLEEQRRSLSDAVAVADTWAWQVGQPGLAHSEAIPLDAGRQTRTGASCILSPDQKVELSTLARSAAVPLE